MSGAGVDSTVVDGESLRALQEAAGASAGLPEALCGRLTGETLGELREDAERLVGELRPPQPRDPEGRFSFSDEIRRQAGRPVAAPAEPPAGSFRVGEGGTAAGRPHSPPPSMTARIRASVMARGMAVEEFAAQMGEQA